MQRIKAAEAGTDDDGVELDARRRLGVGIGLLLHTSALQA